MKLVLEADDVARERRGRAAGARYGLHRRAHGRFRGIRCRSQADRLGRHSRDSGLPREQLERVARIYMQSKAVIAFYGMGITQHRLGTDNVQQLVNLLFLRGNIGRPGAGICPVRGHSNVQGDRTVGIDEKPETGIPRSAGPGVRLRSARAHGHNVVHAVEAMLDGRAKAFIGMGGVRCPTSPSSRRPCASCASPSQ